jgi:hypothetical protein
VVIAGQAALAPEGIMVPQAKESAGWQTVPHAQLHAVPREASHGVELNWPREPRDEACIDSPWKLASRLMPWKCARPWQSPRHPCSTLAEETEPSMTGRTYEKRGES